MYETIELVNESDEIVPTLAVRDGMPDPRVQSSVTISKGTGRNLHPGRLTWFTYKSPIEKGTSSSKRP